MCPTRRPRPRLPAQRAGARAGAAAIERVFVDVLDAVHRVLFPLGYQA